MPFSLSVVCVACECLLLQSSHENPVCKAMKAKVAKTALYHHDFGGHSKASPECSVREAAK